MVATVQNKAFQQNARTGECPIPPPSRAICESRSLR